MTLSNCFLPGYLFPSLGLVFSNIVFHVEELLVFDFEQHWADGLIHTIVEVVEHFIQIVQGDVPCHRLKIVLRLSTHLLVQRRGPHALILFMNDFRVHLVLLLLLLLLLPRLLCFLVLLEVGVFEDLPLRKMLIECILVIAHLVLPLNVDLDGLLLLDDEQFRVLVANISQALVSFLSLFAFGY